MEIIYDCLKVPFLPCLSYGGRNGLTQQVTMFIALKTEGKMCRSSALCCHAGTLTGVSTDGTVKGSSS